MLYTNTMPKKIDDCDLLNSVQVPITTVSASFEPDKEQVVFSRAHYSMANAVLIAAFIKKKSAWLFDPTNFVSADKWGKVLFTEHMGNLIARHPLLKDIKDLIDTRVRNKLPLTDAIKQPLIDNFKSVHQPIISLHYEAGNILIQQNHIVLQVITDPHVRPQYLTHVKNHHLFYAVFDHKTKAELIEKAFTLHQFQLPQNRIFVTGAPVDPRILKKDKNRTIRAFKKRPLRLVITTGGLGTNKPEIKQLLPQLVPLLKKKQLQLMLYTGTHQDFLEMYQDFAQQNKLKINYQPRTINQKPLTIIHSNNLVDLNNQLIDYAFPWADGFITKPSGDMAYEAVAAGCFLLTLNPWGEWEENIRQHFEELGVSRRVDHQNFTAQLEALTTVPVEKFKPWAQLALERTLQLQQPLSQGSLNILQAHQTIVKQTHSHSHLPSIPPLHL